MSRNEFSILEICKALDLGEGEVRELFTSAGVNVGDQSNPFQVVTRDQLLDLVLFVFNARVAALELLDLLREDKKP